MKRREFLKIGLGASAIVAVPALAKEAIKSTRKLKDAEILHGGPVAKGKTYWVDCNSKDGGDGTFASPFKNMSDTPMKIGSTIMVLPGDMNVLP